MVGTGDQQDLVAGRIERLHGAPHLVDAGIGVGDHRQVLARSERHAVRRVVGLREPQHGQRGRAFAQHLAAEAIGHRTVARGAHLDGQAVRQRDTARSARAGAVVDMAEAVGILQVGRARRHVRHDDRTALPRQPLGPGRAPQGAARGPAQALEEVGLAHRQPYQRALLAQHHGVAQQAVGGRQAAGGHRGRAGARGGRKDTARRSEVGTLRAHLRERGSHVGRDQVRAQAVADHHDGAPPAPHFEASRGAGSVDLSR